MSGFRVPGDCYNCGAPATTKDHVVPKSLFPKASTAQRVTVPACRQCNNDLSKDEEYFRAAILGVWEPNQAVIDVWNEKVVPSIRRGYDGLRQRLLNNIQPIYLPYRGEFAEAGLLKLEAERMDRVARKIVKGLYVHLLGRRVPASARMRCHWQPKEWAKEIALKCAGLNIDPDVFTVRYGIARSDDGHEHSIWWLRFYRQTMYVVTVQVPPIKVEVPNDALVTLP